MSPGQNCSDPNPHLTGIQLTFDHIGRWFLQGAKPNVVIIGCMFLTLTVVVVRFCLDRKAPGSVEVIRTLLALAVLYSGLTAAAVFLLTCPPAYTDLSDLDKLLVGALGCIGLCTYGLVEIASYFKKRSDP